MQSMWGATKDGEGLGEISAAQQHKGTSEELLNLAEMKGIGRAESLQQWDIKTDNKQNKTQHVLMKKYACWHRSNMRDMAAWLERGVASYRAVEHALAIHGNVKATLHPLDGHHSQTHGNKIKQGCRADRVEEKQLQRGRDERETSDTKDRIGQLNFHLTLVDTTPSDLCSLAVCQR